MKKSIIILFLALLCNIPLPTNAQSKSVQEVWEEYLSSKDMYTFIDGFEASNAPKSFIPYIPEVINKSVAKGVETDVLFEEMVETIIPKCPEAGVYWGLALCTKMKTIPQVFKVLNAIPKDKVTDYNGDVDMQKELRDMAVMSGGIVKLTLQPQIPGVVTLSGGKIFIKFKIDREEDGTTLPTYCATDEDYGYFSHASCSYDFIETLKFYDAARNIKFLPIQQILMYDPSGTYWAGVLRIKGKDYGDNSFADNSIKGVEINDIKDNENYFLWTGFVFDKNGKKISDTLWGENRTFASVEKEWNAETKKEKVRFVQASKNLNKQIISKYGQKAYEAMAMTRYYVGLPEGAVSGFRYYDNDKVYYRFKFYGFGKDRQGSYKIYRSTTQVEWNGYKPEIYVRNGKVFAWN